MQRGYVKLWRKIEDSGLFQNHKAYVIFSWCLLKATRFPCKRGTSGGIVELIPGEGILAQRELAEILKMDRQSVRTSLDYLTKLEILTLKVTHHFTVFTVINWDKYQNQSEQVTHKLTHDKPTPNPRLTQEQEVKTERIEPKPKTLPVGFDLFWTAYPKKLAKQDALKSWEKISPDETLLATMITAIGLARRSEDWQKQDGQFIPYPATWLNGKRWQDEVKSFLPTPKRMMDRGPQI